MIRYFVTVDRVNGFYANGKYAYCGEMHFFKRDNMNDAKKAVAELFKIGYCNHATIYDKEENTTIERFNGKEWCAVEEVA